MVAQLPEVAGRVQHALSCLRKFMPSSKRDAPGWTVPPADAPGWTVHPLGWVVAAQNSFRARLPLQQSLQSEEGGPISTIMLCGRDVLHWVRGNGTFDTEPACEPSG